MADCERLVTDTVDAFGGIDIIIGNAVSSFLAVVSASAESWGPGLDALCGVWGSVRYV